MNVEDFNPLTEAVEHLKLVGDLIQNALYHDMIEPKKAERIQCNLIEIVFRIRRSQEKKND